MLSVVCCVLLVVVYCLFVGGVVRVIVASCVVLVFVAFCCFSLLAVRNESLSFAVSCLSPVLLAIGYC